MKIDEKVLKRILLTVAGIALEAALNAVRDAQSPD